MSGADEEVGGGGLNRVTVVHSDSFCDKINVKFTTNGGVDNHDT